MATSITVAQAIAYENDPSTIPAGSIFDIVDTTANIKSLTAGEINHLSSIGVSAIKSTDGLVKVDPTGAKETAFANANIPITADITVAKALSLESNVASGGSPVLVPPDERITVVGTAAELESLTRSQLKALGAIIDTTATGGTDSGKTAVHKIAGSDAPPVFTAGDMTALGNAHIAVVAPPNDPTQNDGTTVITGRGMTFDITWDSSVASAPAAFQTDVEEVFQLYADTYTGPAGSPTTLYYHVGFGEVDNEVMSSSDLGESDYNNSVGEKYATVLSQLAADATSPAQLAALATLPATDPTSNKVIGFSGAEAQILGFANAPVSSNADPDGYVGFSDNSDWNYAADPNQTPAANAYDFISTVEHEISEVMGRTSAMGTGTSEQATGDFSLMDLYRFSAPDTRALSPFADPSYFSIDNGTTNLADWNNYTSGDSGDLGDWSGATVNGVVKHTNNSFNDASDPGVDDPFTATDATLMNVLGYDFAAPPPSPLPLASNKIAISAGQLLEYITLSEINPGSVNPPAGDSYVVIDTAFDIESITAPEITEALSLGVSQFIVDGAIADLRPGQIKALAGTPFDAVLTVDQAFTEEAEAVTVPKHETVIVADTAANIEALTPTDLLDFSAISVSRIVVSDLDGVGPLTLEDGYKYTVTGPVSSGETITFADTGLKLTFDDTAGMGGTIDGFDSSDKIRLKDVPFDPNGSANLLPDNVLDVTENGVDYFLQFNPLQNFTNEFFHISRDTHGGADITVSTTPCYCRGTLIETPRGEQRVEALQIGDQVMTRSGAARAIKWIGRRGFAGRFILGRKDILPVCIKAGALGANTPRRDLWISPHHAMYFDSASAGGVLIEAKDLVNGISIVQAEHADKVEYFHIELETHDVIIAEGALSESFIDDDSRGMFHNAPEFHALYPQAARNAAQYCAPRLEDGNEVEAVRRRIAGFVAPAYFALAG